MKENKNPRFCKDSPAQTNKRDSWDEVMCDKTPGFPGEGASACLLVWVCVCCLSCMDGMERFLVGLVMVVVVVVVVYYNSQLCLRCLH